MQLFSRNKAYAALSLGALAALGACGDDVTVPVAPAAPVVISISPPSATMNVGERLTFAVSIGGGSATAAPTLASCTSSNTAVITAAVAGSTCSVTAVAPGNATVTAAASTGQAAAAGVSVVAPPAAISGLSISPSASQLAIGGTVTLVPTVNRGGSAVTVAYTYTSSSTATATVTSAGVVTAVAPGTATITVSAAGTGTGFTAATLTTAATVTVSDRAPGLTSLQVSPSSATLSIGGTQQVTASAQGPQASAATITYGTSAPSIATVSTSGVITAVAAGTATITVTAASAQAGAFAASSITGLVTVTVSAPPPAAQVAITSITQGGTTNPVQINNVNGQIDISVNISANGNNVSSVQLFSCAVGAAACPAAGQNPIAQQTFGSAGASSGTVILSVNTAAFRVNADFSAATVDIANGQQNIVATLTTSGTASSSANSNLAILTFNNPDGFAARHTAPTRSATDAASNLWYGGTGAEGRGSVSIVPVTYTSGRSVSSVSVIIGTVIGGVNTASAGCATGASTGTGTGVMTFSTQARPWTFSYGRTLGTGLNATNIVCSGNTAAAATPDIVPLVTTATDNNNAAYPTGFLASPNTNPAVTAPAAIRGDWAAPDRLTAAYTFLAASTNQSVVVGSTWVNGSYNFADGDGALVAGVNYTATETGIGLATTPTLEVTGCGSATFTALTTNTAADVAECATDVSAAAYTIRYTPIDRLGNAVAYSTLTPAPATASATFGVDKTAPIVRWSASTDANGSLVSSVAVAGTAADTIFSAEAIDDRAGLNVAQSAMARANNAATANRTGTCVLGSLPAFTTTLGGSFITNPSCTPTTGATTFAAAALADGYRMINTGRHTRADINTNNGNGYFTQQVRVFDRAANSAVTDKRYVLLNTTVGAITTTDPAAFLSATSGLTVTGSVNPTVESASFALEVRYGLTNLRFPAVASGKSAFDDVALGTSVAFTEAVSLTLPFTSGTTFYTGLEQTTPGTNVVNAAGGSFDAASNVAIHANTFTSVNASQAATGFGGSLITADNTNWNAKNNQVQTFAVVDSTAAFNSPAGGLKARVITANTQTASPFIRVDFYQLSAGGYSYLGSVNAQSPACTSGTCDVYYSDNGLTKSWTYVLRSNATDYTGAAQRLRGTAEVAALNAAVPAPAVPFAASQVIAIATGVNVVAGAGVPAGRGLMSQLFTLP